MSVLLVESISLAFEAMREMPLDNLPRAAMFLMQGTVARVIQRAGAGRGPIAASNYLRWNRALRFAWLVLLALAAAASVLWASSNALALRGSMDFGITLKAAQHLQAENIYERYLTDPIRDAPAARPDANPFGVTPVQAPSALMLLWPYAGLDWPDAKLAWLVSNLAFTAGLLWLSFRRFLPGRPLWLYAAIACLLLTSTAWRNVINNGQHLIAALFFLLAAMELADRGRRYWAGLALALALVKYTIVLFLLPYFIVRRQWVPLAVALAAHGAMTIAIALWLGENPVAMVVESMRIAGSALESEGYVDLFAVAQALGAPTVAPTAAAALLLPALWPAVGRRPVETDLYLAALCALSTVIVYHRSYDFIVLLIPLLIVGARARRDDPLLILLVLDVLLIWYADRAFKALLPAHYGGWSALRIVTAALWYATLALLLYRASREVPPQRPRGSAP